MRLRLAILFLLPCLWFAWPSRLLRWHRRHAPRQLTQPPGASRRTATPDSKAPLLNRVDQPAAAAWRCRRPPAERRQPAPKKAR